MATLTAARASATQPVYAPMGGGTLAVAWGKITLGANPTAGDIIEFVRLPRGSVVVGGYLRGDDLDTGTEELDIDIGWAANGVESADADGFGNLGVLSGDAITDWKPEVSLFMPLNGVLKDGPVSFSAETVVQGVVNVDAATGGTGDIWLCVFYYVA